MDTFHFTPTEEQRAGIKIPLTQGFVAIVDRCDADLALVRWAVYSPKNLYAHRHRPGSGKHGTTVRMYRVIMERILDRSLKRTELVDHVNGDTLDNRRSNLRVATHAENIRNAQLSKRNSSGFKGVSYMKSKRKWRARIRVDSVERHLGLFETPEAAHEAYCKAARVGHGEFARYK